MKSFLLKIIQIYQNYLSADTGKVTLWLFPGSGSISHCRYIPSCSEYMYGAIDKYGVFTGLKIGLKRILSCHPYSKGGYNPVP